MDCELECGTLTAICGLFMEIELYPTKCRLHTAASKIWNVDCRLNTEDHGKWTANYGLSLGVSIQFSGDHTYIY